jgi:stage II sporulation SpoAA-like protein
MAVEIQEKADGKLLVICASGKLTKEDYERFLPEIERLIGRHGKIRVEFDMRDFHGWTAGALWEDMKFDLKHFRDIERLAMVGDRAWEHAMAVFCRPFTTAQIRYFDRAKADLAEAWIEADLLVTPASGSGGT